MKYVYYCNKCGYFQFGEHPNPQETHVCSQCSKDTIYLGLTLQEWQSKNIVEQEHIKNKSRELYDCHMYTDLKGNEYKFSFEEAKNLPKIDFENENQIKIPIGYSDYKWNTFSDWEKEEIKRKTIDEIIVKHKSPTCIVTTADLKEDYEVIGPVFFQVSNKGLFGSSLSDLTYKYETENKSLKEQGQLSNIKCDFGFIYGEWGVGHNDFDKAFYIAVNELKKKCVLLGGDAIVGMRQDIDLDTVGFQYFYLQMYGTAVKRKNK